MVVGTLTESRIETEEDVKKVGAFLRDIVSTSMAIRRRRPIVDTHFATNRVHALATDFCTLAARETRFVDGLKGKALRLDFDGKILAADALLCVDIAARGQLIVTADAREANKVTGLKTMAGNNWNCDEEEAFNKQTNGEGRRGMWPSLNHCTNLWPEEYNLVWRVKYCFANTNQTSHKVAEGPSSEI